MSRRIVLTHLLLVTISHKVEGIEESKRRLGSKFVLEGLQGSGGRSLLGGSKGRGSSDDGGKDSKLHIDG